jgi:hypothetical protein
MSIYSSSLLPKKKENVCMYGEGGGLEMVIEFSSFERQI